MSAFPWFTCQSTFLITLSVKFSYFSVTKSSYYTECTNGSDPLGGKVQTSKTSTFLYCGAHKTSLLMVTQCWLYLDILIVGTAPVFFESVIVILPLFLENFSSKQNSEVFTSFTPLARSQDRWITCSFHIMQVRSGVWELNAVLKTQTLPTRWARIKCDSWEIYCTLFWEPNTSRFGYEVRKNRYWQPVLPVLTRTLKGRKISWTFKQAECLGWKKALIIIRTSLSFSQNSQDCEIFTCLFVLCTLGSIWDYKGAAQCTPSKAILTL